ncbi:hypothetical protein PR048_005314 [Dryococelus australis]|uniref:Uncharacterized protein n=1 Tax=Dryococelus australis TaxID=614101 RepID=A0ABQ9IA03_9NEOP|nr:hypothetical protein PR048_005314 [Dryococelus australis]
MIGLKDNIVNIKDYEAEANILKVRVEAAKTIKGIQLFHSYSPLNETKVLVKSYSFSEGSTVKIVSAHDAGDDLDIKDIVGFVTCQYSDKWWFGCMLVIEGYYVKISFFLEPHGTSPSFKYPPIY